MDIDQFVPLMAHKKASKVRSIAFLSAALFSAVVAAAELEPNNSISLATPLVPSVTMTGQISAQSDDDYYRFYTSRSGSVSLSFSLNGAVASSSYGFGKWKVSIIDSLGNVLSSDICEASSYRTCSDIARTVSVQGSGTYYVKVEDYANYTDPATYSIKVSGSILSSSSQSSPSADYSGAYMTQGFAATSSYSSGYLIVIQKGAQAVLLSPIMIADGAPAGTVNYTGFGIGTVSGNTIDVPQFFTATGYCVNHNTYVFSQDGNTVTGTTLSSMIGGRGTSAGATCTPSSTSTVRTKVF